MPKINGVMSKGVLVGGNILAAADVAIAANTWTEIGSYTVPAGNALALGYGFLSGQDNSVGRFYADLNTTVPGDLTATLRFYLRNARQETVKKLFECTDLDLRTSATDRRQQMVFSQQMDIIFENWQVYVVALSAAAVTLDVSTCVVNMDVTFWPTV